MLPLHLLSGVSHNVCSLHTPHKATCLCGPRWGALWYIHTNRVAGLQVIHIINLNRYYHISFCTSPHSYLQFLRVFTFPQGCRHSVLPHMLIFGHKIIHHCFNGHSKKLLMSSNISSNVSWPFRLPSLSIPGTYTLPHFQLGFIYFLI